MITTHETIREDSEVSSPSQQESCSIITMKKMTSQGKKGTFITICF